jgi:hypothetical protein
LNQLEILLDLQSLVEFKVGLPKKNLSNEWNICQRFINCEVVVNHIFEGWFAALIEEENVLTGVT